MKPPCDIILDHLTILAKAGVHPPAMSGPSVECRLYLEPPAELDAILCFVRAHGSLNGTVLALVACQCRDRPVPLL